MVKLTPSDLEPFAKISPEKASALIADVEGLALLKAPCIADINQSDIRAAGLKAILRGIVLRINEAGSGAAQQVQSGPFSMGMDTRQPRKATLLTSEIAELQQFCEQTKNQAHEIDMMPPGGGYSHILDGWVQA